MITIVCHSQSPVLSNGRSHCSSFAAMCMLPPPISGRRTHGYKIMEISLHESYLISRSPDSPSLPMPLHSHKISRIMYVLVMQAYFLYSGCTPPPHDAAPQAAAGAEPHLTTPVKRRRQRRNWMKIRLWLSGRRLSTSAERTTQSSRRQRADRQTNRQKETQTNMHGQATGHRDIHRIRQSIEKDSYIQRDGQTGRPPFSCWKQITFTPVFSFQQSYCGFSDTSQGPPQTSPPP